MCSQGRGATDPHGVIRLVGTCHLVRFIQIFNVNMCPKTWGPIVTFVSCVSNCQKTDDFYLGRGQYPSLSYCLPGSPMNQANTRKLERDHTENVKRRV